MLYAWVGDQKRANSKKKDAALCFCILEFTQHGVVVCH